MIAPRLNIAMYLRHGCVYPSPVSSCVNSSDDLCLSPLCEDISELLRALLLLPRAVNQDKRSMFFRSRRPKAIFQSYHNGLCGLSSYLGFDSDMKKQSLFVTTMLKYLREFISNQSVFLNTLTIIRYRDNYSIQRLHGCLGSSGFTLLKPLISLFGKNFCNLGISVSEKLGLLRLKNCMHFFVKFFSRSSQFSDTVNSNCNMPPGNTFGSVETRCLEQSNHSYSICVERVFDEIRARLSVQSNLNRYLNFRKRKCTLLHVAGWINPPPRSLLYLRSFLHPNAIRVHQKLKLFSLIPSKILRSGISSMFQQALSTMCQIMIIHNSLRRYHRPGRILLNFIPTH